MSDVSKSLVRGLSDIAIKNGNIINMAEAIDLIAWESTDKKVHALNGVARGIVAMSNEIDDDITAMEQAQHAGHKKQEELNTAIARLQTARRKLDAANDVWNPIEKEKGVGSVEAEKAHDEIVMPAYNEVHLAEAELLKITPASPFGFLRKFATLIDDGGSTCGIDQDGRLLKEAQQLLSAA